jgi:CRP-like cAMP-binding protein
VVPSLRQLSAPLSSATAAAGRSDRDRTLHVTSDEIRAIPIFAALSDHGAERVASLSSTMDVHPGQVLTLQGDAGSGMFVVLEGTVVVELRGGPVELGPGEPLGELALLAPDHARIARVRAKTSVRCLGIGREDFHALVADEPGFALALLRILAVRLAGTQTA